jgi:hypothetical protein
MQLTLTEKHRLRVFENGVLRKFRPKREEDGSWRKLHNDELHGLYSSPNIVRASKSRRMRLAGHVACGGGGSGEVFTGFWWEARTDETTGDLGVGGRIILRWTLGRLGLMGRNGFSWLWIGSSGGLL